MPETNYGEMMATLGHYVRETRQLLGWSQQHLADEAGTSQGSISRVESGRCLSLPFFTVMNVLSALAADVVLIDGAVPAPFRLVLACATELPRPREAPPDPQFAQLVQTYQALSSDRRVAFVQMLQPLVTLLDDKNPPAPESTPV